MERNFGRIGKFRIKDEENEETIQFRPLLKTKKLKPKLKESHRTKKNIVNKRIGLGKKKEEKLYAIIKF